jgi:hypothetical protein
MRTAPQATEEHLLRSYCGKSGAWEEYVTSLQVEALQKVEQAMEGLEEAEALTLDRGLL